MILTAPLIWLRKSLLDVVKVFKRQAKIFLKKKKKTLT